MLIKTQGIVIKQRNIGENDRMITILTKELGIMEASARGVKQLKSKLAGATQMLCYSEFCIFQGKNYNSINSAETIHTFYDLRLDVVKLSLASYFCDLTNFMVPADENGWNYLRFLLNSLSLLEKGKKPEPLLKSIFELRMMALAGFMPDLVCCSRCGAYESEMMCFLPVESRILCESCAPMETSQDVLKYSLPPAVLYAMRHVIYSDDEKVFSFALTGKSLEQLNFITENYILLQTGARFKSLDIYKQMKL